MADDPPTNNQEQTERTNKSDDVSPNQNDWEKAWPVERIRKEAGCWSLAGDSALLCALKEFSQKMISKTHEMEKEVDAVSHLTKTMGVNVHNVFNDFIMLANSQFVENRVYDDDVSQPDSTDTAPINQEKTREQREAELVPLITQALKHGTDIIDDYFDTLDMGVVDSESEGDEDMPYKADPILEAKDPYVTRPLPHIIGTAHFMQEDDVGLLEPPSDVDEDTQGSLSETGDSVTSEYSESEDEMPEKDKKRAESISSSSGTRSTDEEDEGKADIFAGKSLSSSHKSVLTSNDDRSGASSDTDHKAKDSKPPISSFASELAAKIRVRAPVAAGDNDDEGGGGEEVKASENEVRRDRTTSGSSGRKEKRPHRHKTKKAEEPDLFGADDEDNIDPLFFGKKGGGLFSSTSAGLFDDVKESKGLFDDSDQEVEPAVKPHRSPSHENKRERKVSTRRRSQRHSSQQSDESDLFSSTKTPPLTTQPSTTSGFFGDDEEEDDLFSSAPKRVQESRKKSHSASGRDLFSESIESVEKTDDSKTTTRKKKKLPAGAVSMFGGGPDPMTAALRKQSVTESDHTDDLEVSLRESPRRDSYEPPIMATTEHLIKPSEISHIKAAAMPTSASNNSLFTEEPIDDALFTEKPSKFVPSKSHLLFDNNDDEDDLFTKNTSNKTTTQTKKPSLLFGYDDGNDDGNDLFAGSSPPASRKKSTTAPAMFGADDLFSSSSKKTQSTKQETVPAPAKSSKTKISLFDDEEDDLFSLSKPAKPAPAPAVAQEPTKLTQEKPRTKSLFDDDDGDLFGSMDACPSVDLFGSITAATKPEKPPTSAKPLGSPDDTLASPLFGSKADDQKRPTVSAKPSNLGSSSLGNQPATAEKHAAQDPNIKAQVRNVTTTTSDNVAVPEKKLIGLFGSTDDDDDLFSTKLQTKAKIPPGAVNVFGGREHLIYSKPIRNERDTPSSTHSATDSTMNSRPSAVADLQAKLSFDPTILPGGRPPLMPSHPTSVSFEEPAKVDTLVSATKTRAKIQQKRRPPSRGLRKTTADETSPPAEPSLFSASLPTQLPSSIPIVARANKTYKPVTFKPAVSEKPNLTVNDDDKKPNLTVNDDDKKTNLTVNDDDEKPNLTVNDDDKKPNLTVNEDDEKLVDKMTASDKQYRPSSSLIRAENFLVNDEIFVDKISVKNVAENKVVVKNVAKTDLFKPNFVTDIFSLGDEGSAISQPIVVANSNLEKDIFSSGSFTISKNRVDIDDMFKVIPVASPADSGTMDEAPTTDDTEKLTNQGKQKNVPQIDEHDDDLFSSSIFTKQPKTKEQNSSAINGAVVAEKSVVPDEAKPSQKHKMSSGNEVTSNESGGAKPAQGDDDIFVDASLNNVKTKKTTKRTKAKTKDESLFVDDTDIFSDLPPMAPKERKKKTAEKKSIFADNVDDIFAGSTSKVKVKKSSSKKTTQPSTEVLSTEKSIFDDPLGLSGP